MNQASNNFSLSGSKSISNRVLLIASLAKGRTKLTNLLLAQDTEIMLSALKQLGINYTLNSNTCIIDGGNLKQPAEPLYMGNAGTAIRPLTAVIATSTQLQNVEIVCDPRMEERPIGALVTALKSVQADINYQKNPDFPPLLICGKTLTATHICIDGTLSSQYVSALLISSVLFKNGLTIEITGTVTSKPYIDMTIAIMRQFNVIATWQANKIHIAPNQAYQAQSEYNIEPDASTASYFLAAGALTGSSTITGLNKNSIQGEVAFCRALEQMGLTIIYEENAITCLKTQELRGITIDAGDFTDSAMTLAVLAVFAKGVTKITNIGNWKIKETDRIQAMATELSKIGAQVTSGNDFIKIKPPVTPNGATINTYNDHRMAMAFGVAQIKIKSILILNKNCVNKTCPNFFNLIAKKYNI